jgi:hypothetical protein
MLVLGAIYCILGLYFMSFGVFHINALFCFIGGASSVTFVALTFKDLTHYEVRSEDQRELIDFQELEEMAPAQAPKPNVLLYLCGIVSLLGSGYMFVVLGLWFHEIFIQEPGMFTLSFPIVLIIFTLAGSVLSIYYIAVRLFSRKREKRAKEI